MQLFDRLGALGLELSILAFKLLDMLPEHEVRAS